MQIWSARTILGATVCALPLALSGCAATMNTTQASAESVAICFDPKKHQQADTLAPAQKSCAAHQRRARYAASTKCGTWTKAIYTCVK